MRFKKQEVSASGKRQYLIALGRIDIELLLGEARNALRYFPQNQSTSGLRKRLAGIVRGLEVALEEAIRDGDEGDRLPWSERKSQLVEKRKPKK